MLNLSEKFVRLVFSKYFQNSDFLFLRIIKENNKEYLNNKDKKQIDLNNL